MSNSKDGSQRLQDDSEPAPTVRDLRARFTCNPSALSRPPLVKYPTNRKTAPATEQLLPKLKANPSNTDNEAVRTDFSSRRDLMPGPDTSVQTSNHIPRTTVISERLYQNVLIANNKQSSCPDGLATPAITSSCDTSVAANGDGDYEIVYEPVTFYDNQSSENDLNPADDLDNSTTLPSCIIFGEDVKATALYENLPIPNACAPVPVARRKEPACVDEEVKRCHVGLIYFVCF